MFIKSLKISTDLKVIRDIHFNEGLNLIIDNTPTDNQRLTGNNVGKTTVLKLIYFCLGGEGKEIYTDEEHKKAVYTDVRDYLIDNKVLITLVLVRDIMDDSSDKIIIERNFLSGKAAVRRINGKQIAAAEFENELMSVFFPLNKADKPTFKQIISHNIRYKDDSVNKTLKTLNKFTTDVEYETLYLYLLGCSFDDGGKRQLILSKISQEKAYKERLEQKNTKNSYEIALAIIEDEITDLKQKKSWMKINENLEVDIETLNEIKYKINKCSSVITKLEIRRNIINETKEEMEKKISTIDLKQLEVLYHEAKENIKGLQRTFEDLVNYHNKMIVEKVKYITRELPALNARIDDEKKCLKELLKKEKIVSSHISESDSFEKLETVITELNEKYRLKGEYESIISQIKEVEENLNSLENELNNIDNVLYSTTFEEQLKNQVNKFNKYFSTISNELYGEKYALKFEKVLNKKTNKPVYQFSAFNLNMSSGKKQGEILCFDLAYILFANDEKIPCLHFLLNDKKELMHDNQLLKIADFVEKYEIQLIVSILRDKLPEGLLDKANIAVELLQADKLFRIEKIK